MLNFLLIYMESLKKQQYLYILLKLKYVKMLIIVNYLSLQITNIIY